MLQGNVCNLRTLSLESFDKGGAEAREHSCWGEPPKAVGGVAGMGAGRWSVYSAGDVLRPNTA